MTDKTASSERDFPETAEALYENAPSGYLYTAPDGRIRRANETFLRWTGYAREELVGKHFTDLLSVGGRMFYETHMYPTQQMHGHINEVALDILTKDRQVLPALVSVVQKRDESGRSLFNRVTIFIATERRRYEEELLQSRNKAERLAQELQESQARLSKLNARLEAEVAARVQELREKERQLEQTHKLEAIGRLAGGIAHDFNNLLAGIVGMTEEVRDGLSPMEPAYDDLSEVLKASKKAMGLTKQLLAIGRRQVIHPERVDLNAVLLNSETLLQRMMGPEIALHMNLGRVSPILIDPSQLEQIIMNLVLNSADALGKSGHVSVSTTERTLKMAMVVVPGFHAPAGRYVGLLVQDNGSGIAPEILGRIFEPFFTTKDQDKGTGLGLATVYGIVQQNAGFIEVESQVNVRTTFAVWLPAHSS